MVITRLVKTITHDNNETHDDDYDDDDGWWRQQRWRPRGNDGDGDDDDDDDDVLRLNKTDVCERARVCVIGFVFCHTTDW